MMEFYWENHSWLLAVNCIRKRAPPQMFDRNLNTLLIVMKCIGKLVMLTLSDLVNDIINVLVVFYHSYKYFFRYLEQVFW